eukprot:COSAG06_NODE_22424_length_723_cov_15.068910_2_plen_111_part_01
MRKTPFFWRHFVYQTDQFTKTGSGQNIGKVEKREAFLCAGDDKLAGTVSEIWVEFAHTGNPGQTPEGQEWEPYQAHWRTTVISQEIPRSNNTPEYHLASPRPPTTTLVRAA